jgi:PilZ domain
MNECKCKGGREDGSSQTRRERRSARRFRIGWSILIKSTDNEGLDFDEPGELEDLSSSGAFFYSARSLKPGTRLEVRLRVPFKKDNWMIYSGEVVRVRSANLAFGVAVKFHNSRPGFTKG